MSASSEQPAAAHRRLRALVKTLLILFVVFIIADLIYKTVFNITYMTRERCLIYRNLPLPLFLAYEYFIELTMILAVGIYVALLLERFFTRFSKFFPRNAVTAFLYASLIPVCSCTVLPLIQTMKDKLRLRTIVTFVMAAPLLSPVIISLSFSVLGWQYACLRIGASFLLAYTTGLVVEIFSKKNISETHDLLTGCKTKFCPQAGNDIYLNTYAVFRGVLPYLIIAGVLGIAADMALPRTFLEEYNLGGPLAMVLVTAVGVPLYFCNGAEIIFLRPLMEYWGLPLGSAVAFSLTSTAVCVTSIIMLFKFLGKRSTLILLAYTIIFNLALGFLLNFFL